MDIPQETVEKWCRSDLKLKLLQTILKAFESDHWSMSENRPDLNVHTGYVGDTVIEITLTHPQYGEIKVSGKNFI